MSQISTKFIFANAVTDLKARLASAGYLRSRNAANSGDVNLIRANASDVIEFPSVPQIASGTPSANADIATVLFVNNAVAGTIQVMKTGVKAVASSAITLSAPQTIDGVSVIAGDRVLVTAQASAPTNGIYVVAAGAWSRATDSDTAGELLMGTSVYVQSGTNYANTIWSQSSNNVTTLGTDSISYSKVTPKNKKENPTLSGTDITNQYKDLAILTLSSSLILSVSGAMQTEGTDYSLSTVGGVTRVTFLGDLATGGNAALVSGDIMNFSYSY
jgi:hypothetical protein